VTFTQPAKSTRGHNSANKFPGTDSHLHSRFPTHVLCRQIQNMLCWTAHEAISSN